jgi:lambda family phage portal protein
MGLRTWFKQTFMGQPRSSFEAARRGRLTYDFMTPETSADAEIRHSLVQLRNSARALSRDNPHARAIKRTYRVNIFGSRGIRLQAQVKKIESGDLDELRNKTIEKEYGIWCRADSCDVRGMATFHAFELDIASAMVDSGELFFRIVRGRTFGRSKVPLALQAIEADQLDIEYTGISDRANHVWRLGIERDEWGRATRYKFLKRHPGDYDLTKYPDSEKHLTLSAADVIHVYGVAERVGQTRMEPILAPIILPAWNLSQYRKAHITRKRVQASQLGWIQTPDGQFVPDEQDQAGRKIVNSEPGQYRELDPGQTVVPPQFGPDDNQYGVVVKTHIRDQATGTGCSYSTISKDYSDTNYSSLRISVSEDRDWWRMLQTAVIEQFHQRVYEEFLYAGVMYGVLPSPTFDDYWTRPDRYTTPRWQARAWSPLDPAKEAKAMREERELQLKTHSQQLMDYSGEDFEETIVRIDQEREFKQERGLLMPIDDPQFRKPLYGPAEVDGQDRDPEDRDDDDGTGANDLPDGAS